MIKATRHQRTALYRLFDAVGDLLYVGISGYPTLRFQQHAADKPWWIEVASHTVEWLDDRPTAETAEIAVILAEEPRFNSRRPTVKPAQSPARVTANGKRVGRAKFVPNAEQAELLGELKVIVAERNAASAALWRSANEALAEGESPTDVARACRVSRSTMYRKLRECGYDVNPTRSTDAPPVTPSFRPV